MGQFVGSSVGSTELGANVGVRDGAVGVKVVP